MRIGELADRVGVSTDTIRFYERSGWLPRASRQANSYRQYSDADAEHLRLLIDLRRLEVPLDEAARIAGWCHAGHCAETTAELPAVIAERRSAIARQVADLLVLDDRLAQLSTHLGRSSRALAVLDGTPCCDAASAVVDSAEGGCACCAVSPV